MWDTTEYISQEAQDDKQSYANHTHTSLSSWWHHGAVLKRFHQRQKPTCCLCWAPPPPWPPSLLPSRSSVCKRRNSRRSVHSPGTFTMELTDRGRGKQRKLWRLLRCTEFTKKIHGTVRNKHMAKALQSAQFSEPSAVWHPGKATEGRVQPGMYKQTHACPAVTH